MFTNFKELEAYVLSHKNKKRIVLANAHDEPALSAVVNAHRRGVVDGTLLGKKDEILALLQEMNEDPAEYEIVDFDGPELDAAKAAVEKAEKYLEGNGRVLVRASGTEPLIRVLAEAPTDELCQRADAIVLDALEPYKE